MKKLFNRFKRKLQVARQMPSRGALRAPLASSVGEDVPLNARPQSQVMVIARPEANQSPNDPDSAVSTGDLDRNSIGPSPNLTTILPFHDTCFLVYISERIDSPGNSPPGPTTWILLNERHRPTPEMFYCVFIGPHVYIVWVIKEISRSCLPSRIFGTPPNSGVLDEHPVIESNVLEVHQLNMESQSSRSPAGDSSQAQGPAARPSPGNQSRLAPQSSNDPPPQPDIIVHVPSTTSPVADQRSLEARSVVKDDPNGPSTASPPSSPHGGSSHFRTSGERQARYQTFRLSRIEQELSPLSSPAFLMSTRPAESWTPEGSFNDPGAWARGVHDAQSNRLWSPASDISSREHPFFSSPRSSEVGTPGPLISEGESPLPISLTPLGYYGLNREQESSSRTSHPTLSSLPKLLLDPPCYLTWSHFGYGTTLLHAGFSSYRDGILQVIRGINTFLCDIANPPRDLSTMTCLILMHLSALGNQEFGLSLDLIGNSNPPTAMNPSNLLNIAKVMVFECLASFEPRQSNANSSDAFREILEFLVEGVNATLGRQVVQLREPPEQPPQEQLRGSRIRSLPPSETSSGQNSPEPSPQSRLRRRQEKMPEGGSRQVRVTMAPEASASSASAAAPDAPFMPNEQHSPSNQHELSSLSFDLSNQPGSVSPSDAHIESQEEMAATEEINSSQVSLGLTPPRPVAPPLQVNMLSLDLSGEMTPEMKTLFKSLLRGLSRENYAFIGATPADTSLVRSSAGSWIMPNSRRKRRVKYYDVPPEQPGPWYRNRVPNYPEGYDRNTPWPKVSYEERKNKKFARIERLAQFKRDRAAQRPRDPKVVEYIESLVNVELEPVPESPVSEEQDRSEHDDANDDSGNVE